MSTRAVVIGWALLALMVPGQAAANPALLFEPATGNVLFAEDADALWHPASLTKLMTAYLTFEALKQGKLTLDSKVVTTEKAFAQTPSKIGLPLGGELSVDIALQALIIKSANDVAMMLAESIAGSEEAFAEQMNAAAKRLGMTRTQFFNPNGLPNPGQITTARDLALLASAILREYPEHIQLFSMPQMAIGKRHIATHNGLLRSFAGADGMKTGFTCDSGYNIVASASRDGRRLVAVVLGEPSGLSRSVRAAALMEHGFQTYDWKLQFGAPTLETLPASANAGQGPTSVRNSVMTWDCGGRKRPVAKVKRPRPAGAAVAASGQAGGADAAGKSAAPTAATAKAKPKGSVHAARTGNTPAKADAQ